MTDLPTKREQEFRSKLKSLMEEYDVSFSVEIDGEGYSQTFTVVLDSEVGEIVKKEYELEITHHDL